MQKSNFSFLEFSYLDDPKIIAKHLDEYGAVLVRQALPLEFLDILHQRVSGGFSEMDSLKKSGQLHPKDNWNYKFGVASIPQFFNGEDPFSVLGNMFSPTFIVDVSAAFFASSRLYLQANRMVIRRQSIDNFDRQIPYHQDLYTQPPHVSGVINFWTPFIDAGVDAPSVEVVPVRLKRLFHTRPMPFLPENEAFDKIHITKESIVQELGENVFWHPEVRKGDCLVFLEDTIHRTYVTPHMHKERMSIEIRIVSDKSLAPEFDMSNGTLSAIPFDRSHTDKSTDVPIKIHS